MVDTGNRPSVAHQSPAQRSRVANGALLNNVDGRTALARRYKDIVDGFVTEYGAVDESDMARAREAAHLTLWLELEAARTASGEETNVEVVVRTTNAVQRMLKALAASKKQRDRTARRRV